jgi:hypothetical protein
MVATRPRTLRAFCHAIAPLQERDLEPIVAGDLTAELALVAARAARISRRADTRFT